MSLREGSVRVSLGNLLHDQWTSGLTGGYSPNWPPDDPKHIRVQRGNYNQDYPVPQLSLTDVSSTQVAEYWKADGSGLQKQYDGRIDATVFVGSEDDLPEDSQLLAHTIGQEVREIVHATDRLVDPHTSGLLTETIEPLSEPVVRADPDAPEARYSALVEVGYRRGEQPPNR